MKARLRQTLVELRASYWFWPATMATLALLLGLTTTAIDASIGSAWPDWLADIHMNQPDGARSLLATVAGSMITVTGITFSLTLLAVSHATSQFGPRLLTNFMRDRGNQFTLGTFVATYLYCLVVLRTIRSEEGPPAGAIADPTMSAFVPHVSIFVALVMTVVSVGVLIYFFHHVPESMRLEHVAAEVGRDLLQEVDELFPESIGHTHRSTDSTSPRLQLPDYFGELSVTLDLPGNGYIQTIDGPTLINAARAHDLIIEVLVRPGDFVSRGQSLVRVYPRDKVSESVANDCRSAFAYGSHRTSPQNTLFLVDQLVEVAARALSPGVNDPMSAATCLDWLKSVLIKVGQRDDVQSARFDSEGDLRVYARAITFEDFCESVFGQLRPYLTTDRNALLHAMAILQQVDVALDRADYKGLLRDHADLLIDAAEDNGMQGHDLKMFRQIRKQMEEVRDIDLSP